jgi:hypothetical protein
VIEDCSPEFCRDQELQFLKDLCYYHCITPPTEDRRLKDMWLKVIEKAKKKKQKQAIKKENASAKKLAETKPAPAEDLLTPTKRKIEEPAPVKPKTEEPATPQKKRSKTVQSEAAQKLKEVKEKLSHHISL